MEAKEQIIASLEERKVALQEVLTPDFFEDMIKYGIFRLSKQFNIRYDLERGFRGLMIDDQIAEVIASFLQLKGGRNWYKTKFPSFKKQFLSAFDSHICNTIQKELDKHINTELFPEQDDIIPNNESSYNENLNLLLDALKSLDASDDELLLFEPYYIHEMKREEIAKLFGKSVEEVTNIKKKLNRKLPILNDKFKKLSNEG